MRAIPQSAGSFTTVASRHAADHGLIPEAALDEIAADAEREEREGGRLERLLGSG